MSSFLRSRLQRDLLTIPPGESEIDLPQVVAGMGVLPGVEIAFTDQAGRNWVHLGDGKLMALKRPPVVFYGLPTHEPVDWINPEVVR